MMEFYIPNKIATFFKKDKPSNKEINRLEKERLTAAIYNKITFLHEEELVKQRDYIRRMIHQILKDEIK